MAWTRTYRTAAGASRFTGCYRDVRSYTRSAGVFDTRDEALAAARLAEQRIREDRRADPGQGRRRFQYYVDEVWFPHHPLEPATRQVYRYQLDRYVMPWFGRMRMIAIVPADVREWVDHLREEGLPAQTIRHCTSILSSVLTTALNDNVIVQHPCKGVKYPPVPRKVYTVITPEQFERLHQHLPDERAKLLIDLAVESGLRWGELVELRPADYERATRIITVRRVVSEIVAKRDPLGRRFLVKDYPKDVEHRKVKISRTCADKLCAYIDAEGIAPDELIFQLRYEERVQKRKRKPLPDPENLGRTEPNAADRTYWHGTTTAYHSAPCRCVHCRAAYAHYRARRRALGKDLPRGARLVNTDGHIPRRWFLDHAWRPALQAADLPVKVRVQDLRHAHASWSLAGGADLTAVKDRLGHANIATTSGYLHTLDGEDEAAIDAFTAIRHRTPPADTGA